MSDSESVDIRIVGDRLMDELDGAVIHANGDIGNVWIRVKVIKAGDTPHSTANLFYVSCSRRGEVYWAVSNAGLDAEGDRQWNIRAFRSTQYYTEPVRKAIRALLVKTWREELNRSLNLD